MLSARRFVSKALLFCSKLLQIKVLLDFLTLKWLHNSPLGNLLCSPATLLLHRWFSWSLGRFIPAEL